MRDTDTVVASPEMAFYAIVFKMQVIRTGDVLARTLGAAARATLLRALSAGDSGLGKRIHDEDGFKPYTSWLNGEYGREKQWLRFYRDTVITWRFTLAGSHIFEALTRAVAGGTGRIIEVGGAECVLRSAAMTATADADAGYVKRAEMLESTLLGGGIKMTFLTPTSFNWGSKEREGAGRAWHTMPDARSVFGALAGRWKALGGGVPEDYEDWLARRVRAQIVSIRSEATTMEHDKVPAFRGAVRYFPTTDDRHWSFTCLLARFAFWSGVGYGVTTGMGQVRTEMMGC